MILPKTKIQIMQVLILDRIFEVGVVYAVDSINHQLLERFSANKRSPAIIRIWSMVKLHIRTDELC